MVVVLVLINSCGSCVNQWLWFLCKSMVVVLMLINGCGSCVNQWLWFLCKSVVVVLVLSILSQASWVFNVRISTMRFIKGPSCRQGTQGSRPCLYKSF
jgi:hypothetical protein